MSFLSSSLALMPATPILASGTTPKPGESGSATPGSGKSSTPIPSSGIPDHFLQYSGGQRMAALTAQEVGVRERLELFFKVAKERAGFSKAPIPSALSLDEILQNPEKYKDGDLEIVLFDVDGTTHSGQFWLGWLIEVLQYYPTAGVPLRRIIPGVVDAIRLRRQEESSERKGEMDETEIRKAIGKHLAGLDARPVQASMDRYYTVKGKRGLSAFMLEEFEHHRSHGRLMIGLSASPEYIVRHHAEDIGIPPENVFGTTFAVDDGTLTGDFYVMRARNKVDFFKTQIGPKLDAVGIKYRLVQGYSDSDSDLPMFEFVREHGGRVTATNAPRDSFIRTVLNRMRGNAVEEVRPWVGDGKRITIFFDTEDAGRMEHQYPMAVRRPEILYDMGDYAVIAGKSFGIFFVGGVGNELAYTWLQNGYEAVNALGIAKVGLSMALGGTLGQTVGHVFIPKAGEVSHSRRWLLSSSLPLFSGAMAANMAPQMPAAWENYWLSYMVPDTFLAVGVLSMAVAAVTTQSSRFSRWMARGMGAKDIDRFATGLGGQTLLRAIQLPLYYYLVSWATQTLAHF